ncbi:hypothetical protein J4573_07925 [Actinomadura barringtoniae]|uniref:Uncharacterized protein n=1 Tax=Actinomadura barringtoniae TaxID=1427535 RepID=A0A939P7J4_9ACTN|nr:hypothetical protein [Actinomadura barringtoniae]MBO2447013.1 hypothetical protein [Actinomadura barringtoniae]
MTSPFGSTGHHRHDTARARLGPSPSPGSGPGPGPGPGPGSGPGSGSGSGSGSGDTLADDCAMELLGDLDESLWIYDDVRRVDGHAFRHARRQDDHAEEMRRILYRLHRILVDWEAEALIR